jgi:hypothetical protein
LGASRMAPVAAQIIHSLHSVRFVGANRLTWNDLNFSLAGHELSLGQRDSVRDCAGGFAKYIHTIAKRLTPAKIVNAIM